MPHNDVSPKKPDVCQRPLLVFRAEARPVIRWTVGMGGEQTLPAKKIDDTFVERRRTEVTVRYMPQHTFDAMAYLAAAVELQGGDTRGMLDRLAKDYSVHYRDQHLAERALLGSERSQKAVGKFLSVGQSEEDRVALSEVFRELYQVALDYLPDGRRSRRFPRGALFYWAWSDNPNRHLITELHAINYVMRLQEGVIPRHR